MRLRCSARGCYTEPMRANDLGGSKEQVAERLRATRVALDMTARECCELSGIGYINWACYESGRRPIPLNDVTAMANTLKVPVDWLYWGRRKGLPEHLAWVLG